jgi:hypothetical protein
MKVYVLNRTCYNYEYSQYINSYNVCLGVFSNREAASIRKLESLEKHKDHIDDYDIDEFDLED